MINHILRNLKKLANKINIKQILIVVGKYRSQIQESIEDTRNLTYINQSEALGTGHAVQCCLGELIKYPNTNTLILSGDVPMFSANSMLSLLNKLDKARIMITTNNNPTDYGRILCKWLPFITNNNKKHEYYLTDIVEIIKREENIDIEMYDLPTEKMIEVIGVNTIEQLNELNSLIKKID